MTYDLSYMALGAAALIFAGRVCFQLGHFYGYRKGCGDMADEAWRLVKGKLRGDANV